MSLKQNDEFYEQQRELREELREEQKRVNKLRRQGWTDWQIKGWIRGWRLVGQPRPK